MESVKTQKTADPTKGKIDSRQYVVRGESKLYPGTHYMGIFGGFMPYDGGHGRLSEERCRANIKRFASREEALAYSDENNRMEKRIWKTSVEKEPK